MIEQIITQPEELKEACAHLAQSRRFGFDTEFVGEESYHPQLCLIQVATPERLLLIDPLAVGPLDAFWRLIVDPANQVIVHAGREEVRLCLLATGERPGRLFDLQIAAGMAGFTYPIGHGTLVNQLLDIRLHKAETLTEWRTRPLTREQIRYAFDDVRYLLRLHEKLAGRLDELGRQDWILEECARLGKDAIPDENADERWRKLRGLGSLDRQKLAVARELHRWREQKAARVNRPVRALLRDDLIVEIARRSSFRERDLQLIRGLSKRDLPEIARVAESARALPAESWPALVDRDLDPPQVQMVASVLAAALNDFCARSNLAMALVSPTQEIKQLVRSRFHNQPLPESGTLTQGWRAKHILPELLALLEGRRKLYIHDISAGAPFGFAD